MPREVAIVGVGRLGSVLCRWIKRSGLVLDSIVSRDPRRACKLATRYGARHAFTPATYAGRADIVIVSVPDDAIEATAQRLANSPHNWRGKVVLHTSGALAHTELAPLQRRGAATASMHPLMTFAPHARVTPEGLLFGIEGQPRAVRSAKALVKAWRGESVVIQTADKPIYHLAATLVSPFTVVLFAAAARLLDTSDERVLAGLSRLQQQTTQNLERGTKVAWTGPFARGDVTTIRRQWHAAKSAGIAALYRELASAALELLPVERADDIRRIIAGDHEG